MQNSAKMQAEALSLQVKAQKIERAKGKMLSSLSYVKAQGEMMQQQARLLMQLAQQTDDPQVKLRLQAEARDIILNTRFEMNMEAWSESAGEFDSDSEQVGDQRGSASGVGQGLPDLDSALGTFKLSK